MLRDCRTKRGLSQLELALHAGFSARHVSFIETERNRLLEAAGYAHVYRQTPLASEEMAQIRGVLEFILERHKPYGAVVHDRYSNCIMGNGAAAHLVTAIVDPSLLAGNVNYLRVAFHPLGARRSIVNWDEVSRSLLARAERDLGSATDDATAMALLDELRGYAGVSGGRPVSRPGPSDLLLPIHIRTDAWELRLFSTLMTLGTAQDVTLQELRIETFFPADDESERTWRTIAVAS